MIKREISFDNILTVLAIIVSAATFFISWNKEKEFVRRAQADQVRIAAAASISKLGRWREISASLFDETQASFVEASEVVLKGKNFDIIGARDHLWKAINRARIATKRQIISENIENAYASFVAFYPKSRVYFHEVIGELNQVEDAMSKELLGASEMVVLSFVDKRDGYQTALMGNELRKEAAKVRETYMAEIDSIISRAVAKLNAIIDLDDTALILHRQDLFDRSDKAAVPIRQ